MDVSQDTVARVQQFSQQRQKAEEEYGQRPVNSAATQEYNAKLDSIFRDLQDQIQRQDDDIQKVCSTRRVKQSLGTLDLQMF